MIRRRRRRLPEGDAGNVGSRLAPHESENVDVDASGGRVVCCCGAKGEIRSEKGKLPLDPDPLPLFFLVST